MKVQMFQCLARMCCKRPTSCTDIANCLNFDAVIFQSLIQVYISTGFHYQVGLQPYITKGVMVLFQTEYYRPTWMHKTWLTSVDQCVCCWENFSSIL